MTHERFQQIQSQFMIWRTGGDGSRFMYTILYNGRPVKNANLAGDHRTPILILELRDGGKRELDNEEAIESFIHGNQVP